MHADDSPPRRSGRARGSYKGEQKIEDNPLIKAARMGDAFGVKMNMERWKRKPDASGNYALHIAAQANNVDIVQCLAEHEAELKNRDGETPLMIALSAKALSSAILLVRYSDFETDAKGYGLLEHALQGNSLECVQCVVLYFKPPPEQIYPVLEEAHRLGRIEIAKFLENVMNNIVFIDCGECWKLLQKYGAAIASTEKFSEQLRIIEEAKREAQQLEEQQIPESPDVKKSSVSTTLRRGSGGRRNEPGRSNSVTFSDTVTVMGAELTSSSKDPGLMEQEILDLKARLNKLTVDLDLKNKENESLVVQLQAFSETAKASKSRPKTKDQEAELISKAELDKATTLISQQQLRIDELEQILVYNRVAAVKDSSTDQLVAQLISDDQGKKKQTKKKKDTKEGLEKDKQIAFLQDQLLESEKRCTRLLSDLEEAKNKQVPSPHLIPYMQLEKSYKVMQEDLLRQESKVLDLQNTINKLRAEVSSKNTLLTQARGIIASQKEHLGGVEREKKQVGKGTSQKSAERRGTPLATSYDDDAGADADTTGLHRSSSQGVKQSKISKSQTLTLPSKPGKVKQLPPWRGLTDEPSVDLPNKSRQQNHEQEYLFREHDDLAKDHSNSPTFQHTEPLVSSMMNSDAGSRNSPTIKSLTSPIQSSPLRMSPTLLEMDAVRDSSSPLLQAISPHSPLRAAANVTGSPSRNQQTLSQNMTSQDNSRGAVVKVGPSKGFVSVRQHNPHLFSTDTIMEASIDTNVNSYGADAVSMLADPSVLASNSPTKVSLPIAGRRASGGYVQGGGGGSFANISNISHVEASFNAPASPQQIPSQGVPTCNSLVDQGHHIESPEPSNPIRTMINNSRGMQQPMHQSAAQMATAPGSYLLSTANLEGHVSRIPHPSYKQPAFSFRVGNVLQGPGDNNIYSLYTATSNPPYNVGYAAKSYMPSSSTRG